jgi:hypothetical protein
MEVYVPSAKETCRFYDQSQFPGFGLKEKIEALRSKVFVHLYVCMVTHGNTSYPFLAFYFYAVNLSGY